MAVADNRQYESRKWGAPNRSTSRRNGGSMAAPRGCQHPEISRAEGALFHRCSPSPWQFRALRQGFYKQSSCFDAWISESSCLPHVTGAPKATGSDMLIFVQCGCSPSCSFCFIHPDSSYLPPYHYCCEPAS